jgi:hypothetical protein
LLHPKRDTLLSASFESLPVQIWLREIRSSSPAQNPQ